MMQHLLKGQDAGKIDRIFARLDVNADSSSAITSVILSCCSLSSGKVSPSVSTTTGTSAAKKPSSAPSIWRP